MPILTDKQHCQLVIDTSLEGFTLFQRHDCNKVGSGILHLLIQPYVRIDIMASKVAKAIEELRVSPHTFNVCFLSPIDMALKQPDTYPIAQYLLQQPLQIDPEYLTSILDTAAAHYEEAKTLEEPIKTQEQEASIGFFASRLCGGVQINGATTEEDIHYILNLEKGCYNDKYTAHLQWFRGETANKAQLEGFPPGYFLPIRIRSRVQAFVCEYGAPQRSMPYLETLRAAISRDLQTYWIMRYAQQIHTIKSPAREKLFHALTRGLIQSIKNMPINEAVIIDVGSRTHMLYLRIRKLPDGLFELTVHNLGRGAERHRIIRAEHPTRTLVYPYVICLLEDGAWKKENGVGYRYLYHILSTLFPRKKQQTVELDVYDRYSFWRNHKKILIGLGVRIPDDSYLDNLKPSNIQVVGNCMLVSHEAVQCDLIDASNLNKFHKDESTIPVGRSPAGTFIPYVPIANHLWHHDLLIGGDFIRWLLQHYREKREHSQGNAQAWSQVQPYFIEPAILSAGKVTKPLKDWFNALLLESKRDRHSVHLLLGEAGSGKSSSLMWCIDYLLQQKPLKWLPIFISLNNTAPDRDFVQDWFNSYGKDINQLKNHYHFVFLLDAYDEPLSRGSRHDIIANGGLADWPGVTLITCREQFEFACNNTLPRIKTRQSLQGFNDLRIRQYLEKREPNVAAKEETLKSSSLWPLLKNPLSAYMMVSIWPKIQIMLTESALITRYLLYQKFTENWLSNQFKPWLQYECQRHGSLSTLDDDAERLMQYAEFIAVKMFYEQSLDVSEAILKARVQALLEQKVQSANNTALLRLILMESTYQFMHQSLQEFLVAQHFLKELKNLIDRTEGADFRTLPSLDFSQQLLKDSSMIAFLVDSIQTPKDEACWMNLVLYSQRSSSKQILLKDYPEGKKREKARFVQATIKTAAANAMTVLNEAGVTFSGRNLAGIRIRGAILRHGLFHQTNFGGANLKRVNFVQSYLREANFKGAKVRELILGEKPMLSCGHKVSTLVFNQNGSQLAVKLTNGEICIFDCKTIEVIYRFHKNIILPRDETSQSNFVSFEYEDDITLPIPNSLMFYSSRHLLMADIAVKIQHGDAATKTLLNQWDHCLNYNYQALERCIAGPIYSWHLKGIFSLSPDGNLIARNNECAVDVIHIATNELYKRFEGDFTVTCLAWNGSKELAVGNIKGFIRLWDTETGNLTHTFRAPNGEISAINLQDELLATVSKNDQAVCIWSTTTGELLTKFHGHTGPVTSMASYDRYLATGSLDQRIQFWDLKALSSSVMKRSTLSSGNPEKVAGITLEQTQLAISYNHKILLFDCVTGKLSYEQTREHPTMQGLAVWYNTQLLIDGPDRIEIRNPQTWTVLQTLSFGGPMVQLEIQGNLLVGLAKLDLSKQVLKLWDLDDYRLIKEINEDEAIIGRVSLSSEKQLVIFYENGAVRLFDIPTGEWLIMEGQHQMVTSVYWHPNKGSFLSVNKHTINDWCISTKKCCYTLEDSSASIIHIEFILNGDYFISFDKKGEVRLWNYADKTVIDTYQLGPIQQIIYRDAFLIASSDCGDIKRWEALTEITRENLFLPKWQVQRWIINPRLCVERAEFIRADVSASNELLLQQRGASFCM